MPLLEILNGSQAGTRIAIGDLAVIGRNTDADVTLNDATVSRQHARVIHLQEGYTIQDLNSGNGTMVDGRRVNEMILKHGCEVALGETRLRFIDPDEDRFEDPQTELNIVEDESDIAATTMLNALDLEQTDYREITTRTEPSKATERITKRLQLMGEISNLFSSSLDEKVIFHQILDKLFEMFPQADRGFVIMVDPDTSRLVPRAARTGSGAGDLQSVAISQTIVRAVMRQNKAVITKDAMTDERFAEGASIVNLQMRSVMCVPILARGEILGILHLDTLRPGAYFTEQDLALSVTVASQAGLAIHSARLHDKLLQRQRLEQELRYANRIQHSFLPKSAPESPVFEFYNSYRAALEVGGDFYDMIRVGPNRIALAIGDVSGKGIPAALMMAKLASDTRFMVMSEQSEPGILSRLNESFIESSTDESFVTMLLVFLDETDLSMTITSAGHPQPVIYKASDRSVQSLDDITGFPIGVVPDADYERQSVQLDAGDVFVVLTDGILEAMNSRQECYGSERLHEVMRRTGGGASDMLEAILDDVRGFTQGASQSDDLTLLCVGARAPGRDSAAEE